MMDRSVLFVTHHYLDGNGGGVYASRSFINALACLSDVTLLCPVSDRHAPEEIFPSVRQIPVPYAVPKWRKALDLLRGRIHRYSGVLERVLREKRYDTVVFDTCYPSFRMIDRVRGTGCRIVTIHHNCQYDYAKDSSVFPFRIRTTRAKTL